MRTKSRAVIILAAAVVVAGGGTGLAVARAAGPPSPPPAPDWVTTGPSLVARDAPVEVPVVGKDGKLVTDGKGKVKHVVVRLGDAPSAPRNR